MQAISTKENQLFPTELVERNQWVLYKLEPVIEAKTQQQKIDEETGEPKFTKVPYQVNGKKASATSPMTWTSYNNAVKHSQGYSGLGYVLTDKDPYTVIDLDKHIVNGEIQSEAKTLVDTLDSYTEYSQSGTGLHIFIKGKKPGERSKNASKGIEIYDNERFIVMTGNHLDGTPVEIHERQDILNYIYDSYFPVQEPQKIKQSRSPSSPKMTDEEILKIARNAKNKEKFITLYDKGDTQTWHNGDNSAADQGLCNMLAFYTQDHEQLDRLMRKSALYREKWDVHHHYLQGEGYTIQKAIDGLNDTYQKREFQQLVNEDMRASWWLENQNGTRTFLHEAMAKYILQEHPIVRFPDAHGDLYIYDPEKGLYENDKSCRGLRSIIRKLEPIKSSQVREVQEYILDMSPVVRNVSDEYVALNNGLLHFRTMAFKAFTPDVFVINKIPTNYNPNAYDSFVDDTLQKVTKGHVPSRKNIEEMFACILFPKVLVPKMFYLYGRTAHNGKSSILLLIHKTFNLNGGNLSAVPPQKLAENTFASSSLYGKLANIVDDQPDQQINDAGALKSIITGGYVEVEQKGKDSRTVEMNTVMITASNYYPNFKEHGKQINRRLHIIPFEHDFSSDPDCVSEVESMERLSSQSAREYTLRLAIEALKRMLAKGSANRLTVNEKAEEAGRAFSEYNDPLVDFFFKYDKAFFEEVRGTDALAAYEAWCRDNHIKHPLGQKRFKDEVCAKYNMVWKNKRIKINGSNKVVKGFAAK